MIAGELLAIREQFFKALCNRAVQSEKPEAELTVDKVSKFFLEFVDEQGSVDGGSGYFKGQYQKKYGNRVEWTIDRYVYEEVLSLRMQPDLSSEYLRLKARAKECINLLREKRNSYTAALEKEGRSQKGKRQKPSKEGYLSKELSDRINDLKRQSSTESLIKKAIYNCSGLNHFGLSQDSFIGQTLSALLMDLGHRELICFGKLPVPVAEQLIRLKDSDPRAYLDAFQTMISKLQVLEEILNIVSSNFYVHNRKELMETAVGLFRAQKYEPFVYLVVPQIEGLFQQYRKLLGDNSKADGMLEISKKVKESATFHPFIYFAFEFSGLRNLIAHGEMVPVGEELACEVVMDLHWILSEIDSKDT